MIYSWYGIYDIFHLQEGTQVAVESRRFPHYMSQGRQHRQDHKALALQLKLWWQRLRLPSICNHPLLLKSRDCRGCSHSRKHNSCSLMSKECKLVREGNIRPRRQCRAILMSKRCNCCLCMLCRSVLFDSYHHCIDRCYLQTQKWQCRSEHCIFHLYLG